MTVKPWKEPTDKHSLISRRLYHALKADPFYAPQVDHIMAEDMELSPDFLGFTTSYYHLAQLIPTDRVVYDMGCNTALQAWYFRKHHAYIGVDLLTKVKDRVHQPNTKHYHMPIEKFLATHKIDDVHFAICNYVPPWGADNEALVRKYFKHLFVYYPESRRPDPILEKVGT